MRLGPLANERSAEVALGKQTIMRGAKDTKVVERLVAAARPRLVVVDLSELGLCAAPPVQPNKSATEAVTLHDPALRCVRDVSPP